MSKGKRRSSARFMQLHHRLLKSKAWHCLTPLQRCGYIELAQLYDGSNNGRLAMSTRRLAGLIPCSKTSPILQELEDAGFIERLKKGKYTRKADERMASEYRLTDFRCDATGELPTREYNERQRWEPSEPKPKRKALTAAERVRNHRRRNACNAERTSEWDGTVPVSGADFVTRLETTKRGPRKSATNDPKKGADVTLSEAPTGTLIHLTRGVPNLGTNPRRETGAKTTVAPFAVGHDQCKRPSVNSLPPGWHWCRREQRVVTDVGIVVPIVDDPLVGSAEQRGALRDFTSWSAKVIPLQRRTGGAA